MSDEAQFDVAVSRERLLMILNLDLRGLARDRHPRSGVLTDTAAGAPWDHSPASDCLSGWSMLSMVVKTFIESRRPGSVNI